MRTVINVAISACLLSLAAVNLAVNPFLPRAYASTEFCEGDPPGENCICCEDCGCWVCE